MALYKLTEVVYNNDSSRGWVFISDTNDYGSRIITVTTDSFGVTSITDMEIEDPLVLAKLSKQLMSQSRALRQSTKEVHDDGYEGMVSR